MVGANPPHQNSPAPVSNVGKQEAVARLRDSHPRFRMEFASACYHKKLMPEPTPTPVVVGRPNLVLPQVSRKLYLLEPTTLNVRTRENQ